MTQNDYKRISITDFDYDLPTQNIAQQPPAIRGSSKLLVHRFGETTHANFFDISNFIPSNARLVFNDTKVIAARIFAHRETGAKIELFLLSPISPFTDMEQALLVRNEPVVWQGMIGNARKWKVGERLVLEVGFVV
ncbi:MAG: S-adenosylmethionine:tRNA ribosyltransferase-isomerase, partial [Bacteroidia bacterium]